MRAKVTNSEVQAKDSKLLDVGNEKLYEHTIYFAFYGSSQESVLRRLDDYVGDKS